MLRSTHKAAPAPAPLPPNWTEHKAPTGHTYYYNSVTKQSTYTRPVAPAPVTQPAPDTQAIPASFPTQVPLQGSAIDASSFQHFGDTDSRHAQHGSGPRSSKQHPRKQPEDRPKKKKAITGCSPWILVYTKLKRRFVYNPELGESFWKFPPDVMKAVIEMDRVEWEKEQRRNRGEASEDEETTLKNTKEDTKPEPSKQKEVEFDSDEYEEVEVTDDEDDATSNKRPRFEEEKPQGPVEFNEDDIAYQLAAMGQADDYEDYEEDWQEEQEPELNQEDAEALFMDLLDDHHLNPYSPWESIIEDGKIIEDDRYTCLPNMKARKEAWDKWSRQKIQKLKDQREKEERKDPRIAYMAFLQKNATPKLYWPEFRRKFNREAVMKDSKLKDKDREKWYRDYISRLKLSESRLKEDLTDLLKSVPLSALNRSTSLSALPPAILADLRYISLRQKVRDPLIEVYIALQPAAPEPSGLSAEEEKAVAKKRHERERREKALAERELRVQDEKRRQRGKLFSSKEMLREEEADLERAMRVSKGGLLGHYEEKTESKDVPMDD